MKKALDRLFRGIEILIAILLAIMIFLVFANVVARKVFSSGFAWSEEIARICFIYLVYFGAIGAMRDNRHLLVETLLVRIPKKAQKILYAFIQLLIIWLMYILASGSFGLVLQNINDRWVVTQIPTPLIWISGVIAGSAIALLAVVNLFRLIFLKMPIDELIRPRNDVASVE
ncbi:MAG: TRAP transporter small permease [Elusimicrobiota bacterium]|jgi:TRAP-type C4-dicarboxylate transport system permease small subunit|nr:TRAP transporter small permease [Elusimicrobiota bacterium]